VRDAHLLLLAGAAGVGRSGGRGNYHTRGRRVDIRLCSGGGPLGAVLHLGADRYVGGGHGGREAAVAVRAVHLAGAAVDAAATCVVVADGGRGGGGSGVACA